VIYLFIYLPPQPPSASRPGGHLKLSPKISIEKNIANARKAYFGFGAIGAFQGKLNPLSSKTIIEACVLPVCLSGCTNWILTDNLLELLEHFQWVEELSIHPVSTTSSLPYMVHHAYENFVPKTIFSDILTRHNL